MDYRSQTSLPRGIRNNNPGNIKYDGTTWQGMTGNDGTFVIFSDMSWGTRALALALSNMISEGYNTINQVINRWAPSSDNNNVAAYVGSVSADTGIAPDDPLGTDSQTLSLLVRAIANHENGDNYSVEYITDDDIAAGISKLNNVVVSAAQAALVYAQVDPVTALVIVGAASYLVYLLTRSFKFGKK